MINLRQIINDIDKGIIHPIYFLKGDDYYLQNFFIDYVSSKYFVTDPVEKIFLSPGYMSGKDIVDKISTRDLFSNKKIFIVRNPQKMKGKSLSDILSICKKPSSDYLIILVNDDWTLKSTFINKIEEAIIPIDVRTPFDKDLKKWVSYLMKKKGKYSDDYVKKALIDIAGDSVGHLENEIEKICLFLGESNEIQIDDIMKFTIWKRERKRWEFLLALGSKKYSKSITLGKNILSKNESMLSLLIPLHFLFQEILFFLIKRELFSGYNSYRALPPSIKKRIPIFSRNFELEEVTQILNFLGEIDKRQKTTYTNDETELVQFISYVTK